MAQSTLRLKRPPTPVRSAPPRQSAETLAPQPAPRVGNQLVGTLLQRGQTQRVATTPEGTTKAPPAAEPHREKTPPLSKEINEQMAADVERIVGLLKRFATESGDQISIMAPLWNYEHLDYNAPVIDGVRTTPHVDRFLYLLKVRAFARSNWKSLWQDQWMSVYDILWSSLTGYYVGEFKRVVKGSRTEKTEGARVSAPENGAALIAKQEAMGMWGMLKGMGTSMAGLGGPAVSQALAEDFDETGRILFDHEWDASEPLVLGMNAGQIGTVGGDVIYQLMTFGRAAGAKGGKVLEVAQKIQSVLQKGQRIIDVSSGLQGIAIAAKAIAQRIEELQNQSPNGTVTWEQLSEDTVMLDQLIALGSSVTTTLLAGKKPPQTGAEVLTRARIHALLKGAQVAGSLTDLITIAGKNVSPETKWQECGQVLTGLIPLLFSVGVDVAGAKDVKRHAADVDAQQRAKKVGEGTTPPAKVPPSHETGTKTSSTLEETHDEPEPRGKSMADVDTGREARRKAAAARDAAEERIGDRQKQLMDRYVASSLDPRTAPQTPEDVRSGKRPPRYAPAETGNTTVAEGVKSLAQARRVYDDAIAETSGKHEVGIWQNIEDGTYVVRLGQATAVGEPYGRWRPVQHYHTNRPDIPLWRMPARADIADTVKHVGGTGRAVTEIVEHPLPNGKRGQAAYTVSPDRSIKIEFVDETGKRVVKLYKDPEAYAEDYESKKVFLDTAAHPEIDQSLLESAKRAAKEGESETGGKTMAGPGTKQPSSKPTAALAPAPAAAAAPQPAAPTRASKQIPNLAKQGRDANKVDRLQAQYDSQLASMERETNLRTKLKADLAQLQERHATTSLPEPAEVSGAMAQLRREPDLENRLELLREMRRRPKLSKAAKAYLQQQEELLQVTSELRASKEGVPDAARALKGIGERLQWAKEQFERASATVDDLLRKAGTKYRAKSQKNYDEIMGNGAWTDYQARNGRHPSNDLATDHLVSVRTIRTLDEMKDFLGAFVDVPDHKQEAFLKQIESLGDIDQNLVRMSADANGASMKSAKSWHDITYGEAAAFGYTVKNVNDVRLKEDAALATIKRRLIIMTAMAKAAAPKKK